MNIEDELKDSYLSYAMSVIIARAKDADAPCHAFSLPPRIRAAIGRFRSAIGHALSTRIYGDRSSAG